MYNDEIRCAAVESPCAASVAVNPPLPLVASTSLIAVASRTTLSMYWPGSVPAGISKRLRPVSNESSLRDPCQKFGLSLWGLVNRGPIMSLLNVEPANDRRSGGEGRGEATGHGVPRSTPCKHTHTRVVSKTFHFRPRLRGSPRKPTLGFCDN